MGVTAVVVLDSMWDWRSKTTDAGYTELAPRYYTINSENKSGKMLYKLIGHNRFLVTNACPELVKSANHRGTPNPEYLGGNLYTLYVRHEYKLLLVCGKVAWDTYVKSKQWFQYKHRVVKMKHPAARDWTKEETERYKRYLA